MATYYVKNGGSDAADGLSDGNAWETLAKVNASSFSAGDAVYFNKGNEWREVLTVPSSGTVGNVITFGAYGTGAAPIINGADLVATWGAVSSDPSFVSSSSLTGANTGTATISVTKPTGIVQGDLLVCYFQSRNTTTGLPEGDASWTEKASWAVTFNAVNEPAPGGTNELVYIWYKVAGASEPATYDFDVVGTGTDGQAIIIAVFRDAATIEAYTATASSPAASLTATAGDMLVMFHGASFDADDETTVTEPTGSTLIEKIYHATPDTGCALAYEASMAAGATGTRDWTTGWAPNNYVIMGSFLVRGAGGGGSGTWTAAVTTSPNQVFFDGTRGTLQASAVACTAEFDWFWAANVLTVYAASDPDTLYTSPGMEASKRIRCIYMSGTNYITVENLHFKYANLDNVGIDEGSDNTILDAITSEYAYWRGVQISTATGSCDNTTLKNSTISYCGGNGIWIGATADTTLIQNNVFHHNAILEIDGGQHVYTGGIKANGSAVTNLIIEYNESYLNGLGASGDRGGGIWLDTGVNAAIIRYNNSHENNFVGIHPEESSNTQVHYNISWGNLKAGIHMRGDSTDNSNGNLIYNNVCFNNVNGIVLQGDDVTADCISNNIIKNNILLNNTNFGTGKAEISAFNGGENDGLAGNGNVFLNNCLGAEQSGMVLWDGAAKNTYDLWETAYGSTTASVEADPLFTDQDNADFTLQSTSLAINAGVDLGFTQDILGVSVPQGSLPDMGAYELLYFSSSVMGMESIGHLVLENGARLRLE